MSRDVDFTVSNLNNFTKIQRPLSKGNLNKNKDPSTFNNPNNNSKLEHNNKSISHPTSKPSILAGIKKYTIQPSFIPDNQKNTVNQAFKPQIQELKKFLKKKKQQQKKVNQLIAQGAISRDDLKKQDKKIFENDLDQVKKVVIDQSGKARDKQGNLLFIQNRASDLIINEKKQQQKSKRDQQKKSRVKLQQRMSRKIFDKNLFVGSKNKKLKMMNSGLNFLEKGSYRTIGQSDDESQNSSQFKDLNDLLQSNIDEQNRNIKQQYEQQENKIQIKLPKKRKLIKKRIKIKALVKKDTPNIQWWDQPLLKSNVYPLFQEQKIIKIEQGQTQKKQVCSIFDLINMERLYNPITYQKVGSQQNQKDKVVMPMYLTKDQRKKLKRKKKRQKLQQKNDRIKLGIEKPDKPKLKVANMATVYKDQFIMDPSRIQALAREQTEGRLQNHLQTNQSRKLTKAKKQQKILRKLKRDSAKQCKRALFKIDHLNNPSHLFKVNMNAKQLALNGMLIRPNAYNKQPILIIVEGGSKAIKFYKNLMLNRINWQDNGQQQKDHKNRKNQCKLIWQGAIENTTLGKWKNYEVNDEPQTIRILNQKGIAHFWDYING